MGANDDKIIKIIKRYVGVLVMSVLAFLKNNKKDLLRVVAVLALAAFAAALIFVFSKTILPDAEEQNAFGTVYAVGDSE